MPINLTLTPVDLGVTLPIPADTELANSASIAQFAQPLGNGINKVQVDLVAQQAYIPALASAWHQRLSMNGALGGGWSRFLVSGGGRPVWGQTGTAALLTIPIDDFININRNLAFVQVQVDGQTGHAGLPSVMPTLTLVRWSNALGLSGFGTTREVLGTVTDTSANVAAYETVHMLQLTLGIIFNVGYEYAIEVTGEGGTNTLDNLVVGYAGLVLGA